MFRDHLGLLLVLLASVPVQFYLRNHHPFTDESFKLGAGKKFRKYVDDLYTWYYEFQEWLDEVLPPGDTWDHFDGDIDQEGDDQGAYNLQLDLGNGVNMMNYTEEWFATSKRPRRIRPSKVSFNVGEVVFHVLYNLNCVVIGWDKILRAPNVWKEMTYGEEIDDFVDEPHYALLCDMRDAQNLAEEFQYAPQRDLDRESSTRRTVQSSFLDVFFEGFDQSRGIYIMRPWLQRVYPRDAI